MDYNTNYERWFNCETLDPSLKAELIAMNEKEKEDAFYTDLEFGTAGMRGILGAGTNRMNIYTIRKANVGFAKYILGLENGKERGVAIGYDNRHLSLIHICIPAGIFFSIVEVILFQLSILDAIIVVFVPVLFTFFIAVLGLLLNLWKPKFDWVNETVCVKQSMPVMMTMFISMGLVFVIVGGYLGLFANIFDLNSYMYLMIAIFITLSIALYYVLMTWGLRRFDEL